MKRPLNALFAAIALLCFTGSAVASVFTVQTFATGTFDERRDAAVDFRDNTWIPSFGPGFFGQILEDFESFTPVASVAGDGYTSLATGVGTFSVGAASQPGAPGSLSTKENEFFVHNQATSPFSGRYDTTNDGTGRGSNDFVGNWLDSNDITQIRLDLLQPNLNRSLDNLYFFMTDVGDVGGTVTVVAGGTMTQYDITPASGGGRLHFVGIDARGVGPIEYIVWNNSSNNDGWGVDDFGTVVPEPSSYFLMLTAATGLVLAARRRRKMTEKTEI